MAAVVGRRCLSGQGVAVFSLLGFRVRGDVLLTMRVVQAGLLDEVVKLEMKMVPLSSACSGLLRLLALSG